MVEWFKIKEGKQHKIQEPKDINSFLNQGFTITKSYTENGVHKFHSYSPLTKAEAWAKHKTRIGLF